MNQNLLAHNNKIKLLKIATPYINLPLCKIINLSFIPGIFPASMKMVKIVPTFKSESSENLNKYRPISLLSGFRKIIEKMMHQRLYTFFTRM